MSLTIREFRHEPELVDAFIDLPYRIYAGDAAWMPPPRAAERFRLSPEHPFFREGEEWRFLALRDDTPVARCAVIANHRLPAELGLIGFFETEDDPEAGAALLAAALDRLAGDGKRLVRAPVDRDTWHHYRLLIDGFEHEPVPMEPYNKPWYASHLENAGFICSCRYVTTENTAPAELEQRYAPYLARCRQHGYQFRPIDLARFEGEIALLHEITLASFAENYGYTPVSLEEFLDLYRPIRDRIDPAFVWLAFAPDGGPAGYCFGFAVGDVFYAKTIGVVPACRGVGLSYALMGLVYQTGVARGYQRARHCLMRWDNASRRYDKDLGHVIRTYGLYERALPGGMP